MPMVGTDGLHTYVAHNLHLDVGLWLPRDRSALCILTTACDIGVGVIVPCSMTHMLELLSTASKGSRSLRWDALRSPLIPSS
jgi:16S rRNA U1498 N3-methylase RsmE